VNTKWGKPSRGTFFTNYAEKLARPRRNWWGRLVAPKI
jgi:hypothetical protein